MDSNQKIQELEKQLAELKNLVNAEVKNVQVGDILVREDKHYILIIKYHDALEGVCFDKDFSLSYPAYIWAYSQKEMLEQLNKKGYKFVKNLGELWKT